MTVACIHECNICIHMLTIQDLVPGPRVWNSPLVLLLQVKVFLGSYLLWPIPWPPPYSTNKKATYTLLGLGGVLDTRTRNVLLASFGFYSCVNLSVLLLHGCSRRGFPRSSQSSMVS